jgi:putative radical SAM enzyme (TIGR03279 family)
MDRKQTCKNKCIFCFIDQMPPGMRETLYFKDDDARLSFLHGNYITMTNLTDRDIDRIIRMHISPVNVSVHTTDPDLRVKMMKNPHAATSLAYLSRLAEAGIELHGQIVLCRGVNDGKNLDRSLQDLTALFPAMSSVSIVPAGLTRFREGLCQLEPFTAEECATVLDQVNAVADRHFATHGSRLFFCSDEFYLKSGRELPDEEFYEGYPQLENGVGMITSLRTEFFDCMEGGAQKKARRRRVSLATGEAAYPLMCEIADVMQKAFSHLSVQVYCIKNNFFGEHITVAGLLTATDIIEQLSGKDLGDELLLPSAVLRADGDLFLDDKTPREVARTLKTRLRFVDNDGDALARALLGRK